MRVLSRGWFAVVYWVFVVVGMVAVVTAFAVGDRELRAITGAVVMSGVVLLLIARGLVARQRRRRVEPHGR